MKADHYKTAEDLSAGPKSHSPPLSIQHELLIHYYVKSRPENPNTNMSLFRLPNELLFTIAGYLNTREIAFLRSTSKRMAVVLHVPLYDSIYISGSRDSAKKALYYAVAKRDHWLVSRLIEQKVDTLVGDGALLNDAIRRTCSEEALRIFIDCGANLNTADYFGMTPLAAAAAHGRLDLVELLLSRGAEVKVENMPNCPLWQAARSGHIHIFRVLHSYPGTDLNAADHYGRGLLHWMTFSNCPEAVSMIIHNSALDVNRRDLGGSTALANAIEMNYNHIARIIMSSSRTDVNLADSFGNTPLHKAVRRGNVSLVRMLLKNNKVDRTPINQGGLSPLILAQRSGRQAVIGLMERYMS